MSAEASDPGLGIRVRGLGKRYHITVRKGQGTLYDRIGHVGRVLRRSTDERPDDTLWALRDVTFDVPRGHVLGVIGRNGSGKSTLVSILARVTAPTEGYAETRGRIGALLQTGTGFHPELSGRDNIYLSGAILGMSRPEIESAFDRIVEFSDVREFLETPVKYYSSGMGARLGFSVSAHLAADILLVDEVLSVGDASFKDKARDRIRELVTSGGTAVFVSHDLSSMQQLCDSAMVLERGTQRFHGPVNEAVAVYQELLSTLPRAQGRRAARPPGPSVAPAARAT